VFNGQFYGDYMRRYWAVEAAFEKADAIAAQGGAAVIRMSPDEEQNVLVYDTRTTTPDGSRPRRMTRASSLVDA
jgi:hypothetical protein